MKFGMFYIMPSPSGEHSRDIGEMLEQIEYAEELGYDSVWIAEHHCSYGIVGNPAVALAAVAQRTRRIRIGTAVAVLPFKPRPRRGRLCPRRPAVRRTSRLWRRAAASGSSTR